MISAKKISFIFFLLFSIYSSAQNQIDSVATGNSDSTNIHKPYYYVYTSFWGYEHFFDDGPLTSWLITQGQGFQKPIGYYKFTALTIDYLPRNRGIIGCSFLDQATAGPFQGGPRIGGFNLNFHFGIRFQNEKNILDILCTIKYSSMRVKFDSPPPFFKFAADQYHTSYPLAHPFEYYSLYNAQTGFEPFIRYSRILKTNQTIGIILGYHYSFYDEGWTFDGIYSKATNEFPYTEKIENIVSESLPAQLKNPVMMKGFYIQVIYGINIKRQSQPKWALYHNENKTNEPHER